MGGGSHGTTALVETGWQHLRAYAKLLRVVAVVGTTRIVASSLFPGL